MIDYVHKAIITGCNYSLISLPNDLMAESIFHQREIARRLCHFIKIALEPLNKTFS